MLRQHILTLVAEFENKDVLDKPRTKSRAGWNL